MTRDPFAIARNAMTNTSRWPVSRANVASVLAIGDGSGDQVRAFFGDCPLETLELVGAAAGIGSVAILASYARALHGAVNADIEAMHGNET